MIYKGRPFMRLDNIIYYGSMADKYIIMLQVLETKQVPDKQKAGELNVASRVAVQLQYTSPDIKAKDRVVKKSEKEGLYAAMDLATVWLERALSA
ncbi:MAG: hypothetical protein FWH16_03345 [Oscillospiraceae bacterium]|nr:hypothetical protein [Oscillospiraceae bacterium]